MRCGGIRRITRVSGENQEPGSHTRWKKKLQMPKRKGKVLSRKEKGPPKMPTK